MHSFNTDMSGFQTAWREAYLKIKGNGTQNGIEYPWILPKVHWEQGLWPEIRSGKPDSLPAYLECSSVQKHDGVHNLKSSWMLCANLYFPFRRDLPLIGGFLKQHVSSNIKTVDKIELEWAEKPPRAPATLLGEPHGQRGRNQTSPDVAFMFTLEKGGKGIVLTENKFVEHSFYPCSGRKKDYRNPDPGRCMNLTKLYKEPVNQCHMLQWAHGDRTNRKYWDYLKFTPEGLNKLKRCPATNAGYQLFRQQALAEALAQKGPYELVVSCVAYDARNQTLIECLRSTGVNDFTTGWGPLFEGKARFATFTHQQWVEWVRKHDRRGAWGDWLGYVGERYGYGTFTR